MGGTCQPFTWDGQDRVAGECVYIVAPDQNFGNSMPICSLKAGADFGAPGAVSDDFFALYGAEDGWDFCNVDCGK